MGGPRRLVAGRVHRGRRPRVRGSRSSRSRRAPRRRRTGVLDVGCGEGQVARLARSRPASTCVVGVDPTWAQVAVAAEPGRRARVRPGGRRGAALSDGSFDAAVACLVFEHIDDWTPPSPRWPGCCGRAAASCFLLNHPLLQTPGSGWIDDQILDASSTGGSAPTSSRTRRSRRWSKDVFIPFIHRPLSPLRQRAGRGRASPSRGWRSRRRRPDSSPGPPSMGRRRRSLGYCCCERRSWPARRPGPYRSRRSRRDPLGLVGHLPPVVMEDRPAGPAKGVAAAVVTLLFLRREVCGPPVDLDGETQLRIGEVEPVPRFGPHSTSAFGAGRWCRRNRRSRPAFEDAWAR